ncbi:MAG: PD-(D/E)XK nuclease family protein [Pseudomonadota bacterium]|nr:PD-(D/E)XK nuclease family protein [Pseudomonadota bacterium]
MHRLAAADQGSLGLQLTTLPLLAARLAGGFSRPAQSDEIESSLQAALTVGGFEEIEPLRTLPGMTRASARTLRKVWDADFRIGERPEPRLRDIALLERRVREGLPPGAMIPCELRDHALRRLHHAPRILGELALDRLLDVPAVWRPLIQALTKVVPVRWIDPGTADFAWFKGEIVTLPRPEPSAPVVLTCANPRSEVIEALRWARQLIATGRARAHEIAICAASTDEWDDHLLTLAKASGLPIHLSNGVPALSTREGQACAALADVLINGLSQDRVRRLFNHAVGRTPYLKNVKWDWAAGISPDAGLFQLEHWKQALANEAREKRAAEELARIEGALERLTEGVKAAEDAGETFLSPGARLLWQRALKSAPADALDLSLQALRLADGSEAGTSMVWGPATHLAGAPRPYVWLLGLTSGTWPRRSREDPLLPGHLLSRKVLDPDPIGDRQRRAFDFIRARASGACFVSRSRRSAQGGLLPASPLLSPLAQPRDLKRGRIPQHAFSETDRLLARPSDATENALIRSALACWTNWGSPNVTAHDGRVREHHSVIERAIQRTQSATSLTRLLRDPLGFVWRYGLGWQVPTMVEEPLSLDARSWGELVHQLLRRTVDQLEPSPGFTQAGRDALEEALRVAISEVRDQWPLVRPVPPRLLWQHTLNFAETLALKALTLDETFHPSTRSWTEVPFGSTDVVPGDWPWDTSARVAIPGTKVSIRGSIDRLDRNAPGTSVRVTDYKTGAEPANGDSIVISGGSALQRVVYAIAARQLSPEARRIVARLFYLREGTPKGYELPNVDQTILEFAGYVAQACALLEEGKALPGTKREEHDEYRIALPAADEPYFRLKSGPIQRSFGAFTRVWRAP